MSLRPSKDFAVSRFGTQIERAEIYSDIQVNTGIAYGRQIRGCVPFFEEYDAMTTSGYEEERWKIIDPSERAIVVAMFRLKKFISLHEADAVEMVRKAKAARNK